MARLPERLLFSVAIAAGVCALLAPVSGWTAFQDLNSWTYDFLVNHGRYAATSRDIVLVDFDDRTFDKVQRFPMPRSVIADAVERIGQARPRVIGLDVFLSEPRDPSEDAAMVKALTSAGSVIVAAQSGTGQIPEVKPLPVFCQPEDPGLPSGYCKEGQPGALGYAAINMPIESDGFVRAMELFAWGHKPAASFPVFMAEEYKSNAGSNCSDCTLKPLNRHAATLFGHALPYAGDAKTVLIGHWAPEPVTRISAWDVLSGAIPPSAFTDKLVLVGEGGDYARDQHFTPLFRVRQKDGKRERLSGTAVHGAAIATLLDGEAIGRVPLWLEWLVNLTLAGCSAALITHLRMRGGVLTVAGFAVGIYVLAQVAFTAGHKWFPFLTTELACAMTLPAGLGYRYAREKWLHGETEKQRTELMGLFSRYVDPEVAHTIWLRREELSLLGEEREATVLFSDIRSFTAMTAGKPSRTVLRWLNAYFTEMEAVIRANGGFLNKFIGDGLLVVYGVPLSHGNVRDAAAAVQTAFAMLDRIEELNRTRVLGSDLPELHIGIGIHTGSLTCGSVGSANRLEYSVIGETVNLASRLENLTKEFKTEIILSEQTYVLVKDVFPELYTLGSAPVRGFDEPVPIYTARRRVSGRFYAAAADPSRTGVIA